MPDEEVRSGWTVDSLLVHMKAELESLRSMLDIRLASVDRATDIAFRNADRAVDAALASIERSMEKSVDATERRFESVNEFRAQLTDQAATFIRRDEVERRIETVTQKVNTDSERIMARLRELETRITSAESHSKGELARAANERGNIVRASTIIGVILTAISVMTAVYVATMR